MSRLNKDKTPLTLWISADPALEKYVPEYPADDDAKEHNQNLPGMGGVFNPINFAVYHYAGNNPIKYTDPSGKDIRNNTDQYILAKLEDAKNGSDFVILKPQDTYTGKLDGAILSDGTYIKVTDHAGIPTTPNFSVENKKGDEKLKFDSPWDGFVNALGDFFKGVVSGCKFPKISGLIFPV